MLILRGVEGNVEAEHTQYSRGHQLWQLSAKVCRSIDNNVGEVGGKVAKEQTDPRASFSNFSVAESPSSWAEFCISRQGQADGQLTHYAVLVKVVIVCSSELNVQG